MSPYRDGIAVERIFAERQLERLLDARETELFAFHIRRGQRARKIAMLAVGLFALLAFTVALIRTPRPATAKPLGARVYPRPELREIYLHANGALSTETAHDVLAPALERLRACYSESEPDNATLRGTVDMTFTIPDRGAVQIYSFVSPKEQDGRTDVCFVAVLHSLEFPRSWEGRATSVRYTLEVTPRGYTSAPTAFSTAATSAPLVTSVLTASISP